MALITSKKWWHQWPYYSYISWACNSFPWSYLTVRWHPMDEYNNI